MYTFFLLSHIFGNYCNQSLNTLLMVQQHGESSQSSSQSEESSHFTGVTNSVRLASFDISKTCVFSTSSILLILFVAFISCVFLAISMLSVTIMFFFLFRFFDFYIFLKTKDNSKNKVNFLFLDQFILCSLSLMGFETNIFLAYYYNFIVNIR